MSINRRDFLRIASVSAAAACAAPEPAVEEAKRPNIVFILADDLGYEAVESYGGTSWRTPNLSALAASGVQFNQAYAQPLCTPTRLQVMTGQYNYRNWKAFGILDPGEVTFGHTLQQAGYKTCISGKWQLWSYNPPEFEPEFRSLGTKPEDAGFDDWFLWHSYHTEDKGSRYPDPVIYDNGERVENTEGKYGPDLYTDHINEFMERHVGEKAEQPFFVYYPMALTHGPFNPTPGTDAYEDPEERFRSDEKYFGDMVEYCDKTVGRIVAKLDELGIRDDTLLIFFTDNGSPWTTYSMMGDLRVQGGKGLTTDAGTRVPLIADGWGVGKSGAVVNDLIDSTDIYATILDAADAEPPAGKTIDGRSFLPQLGDPSGGAGDAKDIIIVWHDPRPGTGKERWTAVELFARDKRFKLYDDGRLYDVPADILEERPIPEGTGSPEAEASRQRLRAALDEIPASKREPEWDPYGPFGGRKTDG